MERETLLCIDPGGKGGDTGIVMIEYGDNMPARAFFSRVVSNGFEGFIDDRTFSFAGYHPDHVVCETFVNRNIPGADLTPILIEGAVRWIFSYPGKLTLSPAAGKNSMVTDEVLKKMDMWFPGDHHHDRREAARHGLIWLKNVKKHRPTLEAMYGHG